MNEKSDLEYKEQLVGIGSRISSERNRLGLSALQVAAIVGIEEQTQLDIESGEKTSLFLVGWFYMKSLVALGFSEAFIREGKRLDEICRLTPVAFHESLALSSDLLRRSARIVDAMFGDGSSRSHPELVAALMNSAVKLEKSPDVRDLEEWMTGIKDSLDGICESLSQDPSDM